MINVADQKIQKVLTSNIYADFKQQLKLSNCQQCTLSKGRTQIVVDRGNPDSRVMIIGEAPGEQEDREGKAFVGRSGRLLHQMLLELGFDSNSDSLIANIAKCRPPDNRAPEKEEALECIKFLKKQMELVRPEFVLLLGSTASRYMIPELGKKPLSEYVGQWMGEKSFPGIRFMFLFHPAYILRDPRKKPLMREHLLRFVSEWKK